MKRTVLSLLLVFLLVFGTCLTSCVEDNGEALAKTAKTDYNKYSKEVATNALDALAKSYQPIANAKDAIKSGKIAASFDVDGEAALIELYGKEKDFAAIISYDGESIGAYLVDQILTIDLGEVGKDILDTPISFALDFFKKAFESEPQASEKLDELLDMLKSFIKFDITDEKELEKFSEKIEECFERKVEEKTVTVGEDKIKSIVTTVEFDTDSLLDLADLIWDSIDFDKLSEVFDIGDMPEFDNVKSIISDAVDFNASATYAVSKNKGLPVLYKVSAKAEVDTDALGEDEGTFDLNIDLNIEFPADMSVYKPFSATIEVSGNLIEELLGSEDELGVSLTWEPEDDKEEFSGKLKLKIKAAGSSFTPVSVSINREKKSGDFTITAKAGTPGEMETVSVDGNITSDKKKTTLKIDSIEYEGEKEEIGLTLTFEKDASFPSVPSSKQIKSFDDLPDELKEMVEELLEEFEDIDIDEFIDDIM